MPNDNSIGAGLTRVRQPERLVNKSQQQHNKPQQQSPAVDLQYTGEGFTDISVTTEETVVASTDNKPAGIYSEMAKEDLSANKEPQPVIDSDIERLRQAKVEQEIRVVEEHVNVAQPKQPDDPLLVLVPGVPSNNKVFDTNNSVYYKKYTYGDYEDTNNTDIPLHDRYALMLRGIRVNTLESNLLLPFCDFSYISVIRRLEAQGSREFTAPYTCVGCGQIGTFNFTLDKIGFNTFDHDLPVKVRFHSYPDDLMSFGLPTIGDVITLMRNGDYYKRNPDTGEYLLDVDGSYIIDDLASLASACTSHDYDKAYRMLSNITSNADYSTIKQLQQLLDPGITPFEFDCKLFLPVPEEDRKKIEEENEKKMEFLRDSRGNMPSFVRYVNERRGKKVCGAKNRLNIIGGDVYFFPFRESTDDKEYGILSV